MPKVRNNIINSFEQDDNIKFATTINTNQVKVSLIKVKNKKLKKIIEKFSNRAVIYIRVSSDEQVKGFSLDGQEETCRNFAERNGYEIVKVFREEGQSAKTTKRDEFQKMMKFCKDKKNQIKYIIVYRIDRFTRDLFDLLNSEKLLKKIGIEILTATEINDTGCMGKLNRYMNGLFAQIENEKRADATRNGMKQGFLKGNYMGRAPYGYKNDKNLKKIVPDSPKNKIVAHIFEKFSTGCYSQADIISDLAKKGTVIKPNHMCEILRNPIYCGYLYKPEYCSEPVKGNFEAIISLKTYNTVQDILDGRKPVIAPHTFENEDYPLKQFLKCPYCGKPLTGSNSISQRGKRLYQYYACYNKECPSKNKEVCKSKFSISKDEAEKAFTDILTTISPKDEVIDLFKSIARDVFNERTYEEKAARNKMQHELDKIEEQKDTMLDLLITNTIVKEEYDRRFKKLTAQENEIKANLRVDILTPQEFNKFLENSLSIIQNLSNAWNDSVLRIKKNIQNLIFPNGLSADFSTFQNSLNPIIFKQIGTLSVPYIDKLPPSEFESLSTP